MSQKMTYTAENTFTIDCFSGSCANFGKGSTIIIRPFLHFNQFSSLLQLASPTKTAFLILYIAQKEFTMQFIVVQEGKDVKQ